MRRRIYEDIIQGALQPGHLLQVATLANEYSVSRTPVREALSLLESENVITAIAYKGYLIQPIEPSDVHDVYFMREVLEGPAAESAAIKITAEELQDLREVRPPETRVMTLEYDQVTHDFHYSIVSAAGSKRLLQTFDNTYNDVRRLQYAGIGSPRPDLIHDEHKQIINALEKHDSEQARASMIKHIRNLRDRSLNAWTNQSP